MPELSLRLKKVSEYVRPGSDAADIGTDHAFLPVYLIQNNICKKVIACDVRKGPLLNAQKTLISVGLKDEIELRQSDGLSAFYPDEADDIIICGMGGTLITRILNECLWIKNSHYRLIIQPQSHEYEVREFLFSNGFSLIDDFTVEENGFIYYGLCAEYNGINSKYSNCDIWYGNTLKNKDVISNKYSQRVTDYLKVRYDSALKFGKDNEAGYFRNILSEAEEIINDN